MNGTVKFFNSNKGWGFITCDETNEDYFVHYTDIAMGGFKVLKDGQKVTFDENENESDRLRAKNVKVIQVLTEDQK